MSQAGIINISAGPVPPTVATSYVTDENSPAVPAANVLNVVGGFVSNNVPNGIQTDGSSGGNTLTVQLTNRITGQGATVDGVTPLILYSFPLSALPGTYIFTTNVVAYNDTDGLSSGYASYRTVRTNGVAATLISANIASIAEEGVMDQVSVTNQIVGNNVELQVIGLAGKLIDWYALTTYIFV